MERGADCARGPRRRAYGFDLDLNGHDWSKLRPAARRLRAAAQRHHEAQPAGRKVDLVRGHATLVGPRTMQVGTARYTAEHLVVTTGGVPTLPAIPGAERHHLRWLLRTCRAAAARRDRRQRLRLGGTRRRVAALGSRDHDRAAARPRAAPFDHMLSDTLMKIMRATMASASSSRRCRRRWCELDGTLHLGLRGQPPLLDRSTVLWAIGPQPNVAGLGLAAAGVNTGLRTATSSSIRSRRQARRRPMRSATSPARRR